MGTQISNPYKLQNMDVEVLNCDVYALIKCLYKPITTVVATSMTYLVNTT